MGKSGEYGFLQMVFQHERVERGVANVTVHIAKQNNRIPCILVSVDKVSKVCQKGLKGTAVPVGIFEELVMLGRYTSEAMGLVCIRSIGEDDS